jgi:cytochrome c oxidase cbb3-type subunit III
MSTTRESSKPVLREHVYDGIQEYDQKLPNWWLFTLYIFVVVFVVYWVAFFHLGKLPTDAGRLDPRVAELRQKKASQMAAMLDDTKLLQMSKDSAVIAEGKTIYTSICFPCHGPNLGGKTEGAIYIGLSLVDKEWKYGGTPTAIYKQIYNGTPDPAANLAKGEMIMPPQGAVLGAEKAAKVASFVIHEWHARNP